MFAPNPYERPNYGGASGLSRTHSRSYLFLGGEARYFPFRWGWFEGWIGMTAGALIIADRFTTKSRTERARSAPILGTTTVTVSTEGFAVGIQAGADYSITDQLVLGLALRADRWLLPTPKAFSQESSCDALGDCPTLTGSVAAFEFGLTLGYQIRCDASLRAECSVSLMGALGRSSRRIRRRSKTIAITTRSRAHKRAPKSVNLGEGTPRPCDPGLR